MSRVLIISPIPTHPLTHGSRARILSMVTGMRQLECEVFFAHVQQTDDGSIDQMRDFWGPRYHAIPYRIPFALSSYRRRIRKTLARRLGLLLRIPRLEKRALYAFGIDEWFDSGVEDPLRRLVLQISPDVVIVEYVFMSRVLKLFDNSTLKILDTLDVFSDRHEYYLQHGMRPDWYSTTPSEERRGLNRADAVFVMSQEEALAFAKLVDRPIVLVGHVVPLVAPPTSPRSTQRVLLVGSDNSMNEQGLRYFAESVWPLILRQTPDATLLIAGSICRTAPEIRSCKLLGRVPDLQQVYKEVDLVINPVPFGTGMAIKTLEALGYSKPVVATPEGARGLPVGLAAVRIGETAETLAEHVVELVSNPRLRHELSNAAHGFAASWNEAQHRRLEQVLRMPRSPRP